MLLVTIFDLPINVYIHNKAMSIKNKIVKEWIFLTYCKCLQAKKPIDRFLTNVRYLEWT